MKKAIFHAIVFALASLSTISYAFDNSTEKVITTQAPDDNIININQADSKALSLLKGIGKKRAQAIVSYREVHGNFTTIEDLLKVQGIGKQIIDVNKARLTL